MPDPPGTRYLTDLTLRQHLRVLRQAAREYLDGWRWSASRRRSGKSGCGERAARAEEARDGEEPEDSGWPEDTTTFRMSWSVCTGRAPSWADGWRRQLRSFYETRGGRA